MIIIEDVKFVKCIMKKILLNALAVLALQDQDHTVLKTTKNIITTLYV